MDNIVNILSEHSVNWLGILVDTSIKAMAIMTLAAAFCFMLRRISAATRHLVLTLALLSLAFLPLLALLLPSWQIPILPDSLSVMQAGGFDTTLSTDISQTKRPATLSLDMPLTGFAPAPFPVDALPAENTVDLENTASLTGQGQKIDLPGWVLLIWLAGALTALIPLLTGVVGLWLMPRRCQEITTGPAVVTMHQLQEQLSIARKTTLLQGSKVAPQTIPMAWGSLRPTILLPHSADNWPPERLQIVLLHELAHVKRWDGLSHLFAYISCCIYWFNPLVWLALRYLRIERERACDDLVLLGGFAPCDYAKQLLDIARNLRLPVPFSAAAVAMARSTKLEQRLRSILDSARKRHGLTRSAVITIVLAVTCVVLPLASMQATTRADDTTEQIAKDASTKEEQARTDDDSQGIGLRVMHLPKEVSLEKRVLRFPDDQIVGSIWIRENSNYETNSAAHKWKRLGQAVGQVAIPARHQVKLSINPDAARDLSFLHNLDPNDIYALSLTSCQVNDVDLKHVAHLTGLDSLVLARTEISDQGLAPLGQLDQLRFLTLSSTSIGDEGLAHLAKCSSLAFIRLHGTQITDRGLATLSQMQGLEGLQLGGTKISNVGLQHLSALKDLRHLMFDDRNAITDEGLIHLSSLTALEYLNLSGLPITDTGLSSLEPLTALKMLFLSGTKVTDAGLIHLKPLLALEALHLPRNIGAQAWAALSGHPALRSFEASSDAHLALAVSFPALRRLEIGGKCTDAGMDHVAKMAQLQEIRFMYHSVAHDGFAKLARSKELRELQLSNTNVTDAGLQILPGFPALEELSISRLRGGVKGLKHLARLDSLKRLNLSFKERDTLTDEAIAPIAQLTGLVSLRLEGQLLSDQALPHLEPLTKLEQLHLTGTWLTDKGIAMLTRFPALETLSVKGHFTNRAILDLVKLRSLSMLTMTGNVEITKANEVILAAMPSMRYLRLERDSDVMERFAERSAKISAKMRRLRSERNARGPVPAMEQFVDANGQTGMTWPYMFREVNGSATLDTRGVTIVFEREQRSGISRGTLQVRGGGSGRGRSGGGDRAFSRQYSNGVNTMQFRKYDFKLLDGGNRP